MQKKVATQLATITIAIATPMQPKHHFAMLTIAIKLMHVQLQSNWPLFVTYFN